MTPDPTLAALSDTLFSISVGLYSLALVAFCAQLAFGRRPARELVGAGAPVDAGPVPREEAPQQRPQPVRRWGLLGMGLTVLGALAHGGVLVARGLSASRLPFGNMYEFATASVLVGVVAFLVLAVRSPGLRDMGLFVVGPVVLAMVGTGQFLYAEVGPLIAALRPS